MDPAMLRSMATVLHGITAVAELKQIIRLLCQNPTLVLHGITAVAELKPGFPDPDPSRS